MIPNRLKLVAASGLIIGGLSTAALTNVFAAPLPPSSPVYAAAAATTVATTPTAGTHPAGMRHGWGRGASFTALAGFFGMSTTDLHTQLSGGQSLAQVAAAHGKSNDDLKSFLSTQFKTRLDAAVTAGKMTSAQEQTALTKMTANLDKIINAKHTARKPNGTNQTHRAGATWLGPVAGFLGMQPKDLGKSLRGGQTLAQIATAHGKSVADLKAFLVGKTTANIDTLVNRSFKSNHTGHWGHRPQNGATPTPAATATPTTG